MNKVFISGMIIDTPIFHTEKSNVAHLVLNLAVRHKTKTGELRTEVYRVSAWNNTAKWGVKNLGKGQIVAIHGYLTQRQIKMGSVTVATTEIAVDEFLPMQVTRSKHDSSSPTEPTKSIETAESE